MLTIDLLMIDQRLSLSRPVGYRGVILKACWESR